MGRPVWLGPDTGEWDHVRMHRSVLRDERLTGIDVMVYLAIVDHANTETGVAWPRVSTIAEMARTSERSARRSIQRLEDCRYLYANRRPGTSTEYVLLGAPVDKPGQQLLPLSTGPASGGRTSPGGTGFSVTTVDTLVAEGPATGAGKQEPGTTTIEPASNVTEIRTKIASLRHRTGLVSIPEDDRPVAWREWDRLILGRRTAGIVHGDG